jgi:hypothetical protein
VIGEGVHDAGRHGGERAGLEFDGALADPHAQRPVKDIEHVVQSLVDVGRRACEPGLEFDFAEIERAVGVLAGCLDRDRGGSAEVLSLTRA